MEPKGSWQYAQKHFFRPCPKLDEFSPRAFVLFETRLTSFSYLCLGPPSGLIPHNENSAYRRRYSRDRRATEPGRLQASLRHLVWRHPSSAAALGWAVPSYVWREKVTNGFSPNHPFRTSVPSCSESNIAHLWSVTLTFHRSVNLKQVCRVPLNVVNRVSGKVSVWRRHLSALCQFGTSTRPYHTPHCSVMLVALTSWTVRGREHRPVHTNL